MTYSGTYESVNAQHELGIHPFCGCGGGEHRKGYSMTKAKSRKKNEKAEKNKSKKFNRRDRARQRPEKYS